MIMISGEFAISGGFEFILSRASGIRKAHSRAEFRICPVIARRNSPKSAAERSMIALPDQ
jgi:hypothetical protein